MNELQLFQKDGFKVRVIERDGEPWFVAKDVCEILEIEKHRDAISRLSGSMRGSVVVDTLGGRQEMAAISEAGVYKLVFTSRKPEAEKFTDWLATEVIPAIRKHGGYLTPAKIEEVLSDPDTIIKLATDLKIERQKRIEAEKTNAILMHVNKTYTATEIAKELGYKSATALNNELERRKIQYKQNDTWVLYSRYADKGYVDIKQEVLDNGKVIYHRKWTQLGREFLIKLLTSKSA